MLAPRLSRMPSLLYSSANCYTFFFSSSTAITHCSAINSTGLLPRYLPSHGQGLSPSRPRNFLSQLTRMAHIGPAAIPDPGVMKHITDYSIVKSSGKGEENPRRKIGLVLLNYHLPRFTPLLWDQSIASRRRMHNHRWLCKYGSLFDPEIYETAICNVRSRTGRRRKVPGEPDEFAFDTFFKDMVPRIIQQMRDRSFQFMPVQTEPILQPEGKTRLIATPSLVDDVIQEALRLILEPAFAKSHIHARSACPPLHSARLTMQRVRMWTGTTWLISANRNGFLDNINHTVLAQMIGRDVKDQQILDLYWKLVNAGLVNPGNQEPHNLTAVSKGGILWPLFTDIYLSDFDVWLSSSLQRQLLKGGNKLRKGIERGIQGGGTRIHYIRYGDQWLVGVDGPKSVAVEIKDDIAMYLNMNLKLNIENDDIAITHLATEKCKYLGMLISTRDRKYTESLVGESADYAYGQIVLEAPINELVTKLVERGFAVNPEYPRGMSGWIHLEAEEIMRRYRSIIRSLMNYYSVVDNKNMLRRVFWILRFSAIFTLCRKWRMSTRALFKKLATDPKYADFLKGRVASSKW